MKVLLSGAEQRGKIMKYYLTKECFDERVYPLRLKKRLKVMESSDVSDEKSYRQFYETELACFMKKEKERLAA